MHLHLDRSHAIALNALFPDNATKLYTYKTVIQKI